MRKIITILLVTLSFCTSRTFAQEVVDSGKLSKDTKGIQIATPAVDFKLSGDIYLFDYLPLNTPSDNNLSIYAFILKVDAETKDKKFGLHVETRIRDTKLRPFFNSNIWFQEAYAFAHTKFGDFHVGKFYRKVGFLWDGSFFGNVQYFNGLKLNPEFGGEFVGNKPAGDHVNIEYSAQYITNNDHVDGALAGRDVESDSNASLKNGYTLRIAPTFKLSKKASITVGLSGLTGNIQRVTGTGFQMTQVAGELSAEVGNASFLGEILHLYGETYNPADALTRPGYANGTYYFASLRYLLFKKLLARVSYSQVNYEGSGNAVEAELLPGLVYNVRDNLAVLAEYNYWTLKPAGAPSNNLLDKSLNFVVHYAF